MITGLYKRNPVVAGVIDNAMLLGQTSRPRACKAISQGLRFANPDKGIFQNCFYQIKSSQRDRAICMDPVSEVLSKLPMENGLTFDSPLRLFLLRQVLPLVGASVHFATYLSGLLHL
jgi:hypothetical protein